MTQALNSILEELCKWLSCKIYIKKCRKILMMHTNGKEVNQMLKYKEQTCLETSWNKQFTPPLTIKDVLLTSTSKLALKLYTLENSEDICL